MYLVRLFTNRLMILIAILVAVLFFKFYPAYIPSIYDLELYPEYFSILNSKSAKILLIHNNSFEECETTERLKITAKRMNLDLRVINGNEDYKRSPAIRNKIVRVIKVFKPDFVLVLDDMLSYYPGAPNYMTLTRGGTGKYLKRQENGRIVLAANKYYRFDALLASFQPLGLLKSAYEEHGKKYFGFEWYPTVHATDYSPATPKKFSLEQQMTRLLAMHKEFVYYSSTVAKIKPSTAINLKLVPAEIREIIASQQLPAYWVLLNIKKQRYEYFLHGKDLDSSLPWQNKLVPLIKTLDKIEQTSKTIPDGSYLISLADGVHTKYQYPILAFAADRELVEQKKVVLMPDNEALDSYATLFKQIDAVKKNYPWKSKTTKIFWRGQTTGKHFHTDPKKFYPRLSLMHTAASKDYIDAAFTHFTADMPKQDQDYIAKKFPLKNFITPAESLKYKYLLDVDGHSCSYSRMAWILYSNSLLFKHTSNKVQWYYDKLQPYVHYLPVLEDFSNLEAQYVWAEAHQTEVQAMVDNSRILAEQIFDPESLVNATAEAFVRYSKLPTD